ncbi:FmdB family zinc ribbon protein [Thiothrix eikelboomii]|uniref:FmdB family zinc ribbon protein n=1 Tax=Thiothrix eikelboomii TaxID=92487 RepID=UPI003BB05EC9
MPIYAYQCSSCGHQMEALQKMSDAPLTDCPHCHSASLGKKITAAAFRLGGGGWYETDFKTNNQKNLATKETASAASTPAAPTCGTGACPACQ